LPPVVGKEAAIGLANRVAALNTDSPNADGWHRTRSVFR